MKKLILLLLASLPLHAQVDEAALYPVPEESRPREGVTYGEWVKAPFTGGRRGAFPGTEREIQVYVPDGWDGETPACVCVMLDNAGFNMPTLISNLIAAKELPMMFIVVVPPGRVPGARGDPDSARANRTFEYDTPSPALGRFILEEVFPFIEKNLATQDGRKLLLSKDGNDRMIAGASSGGAAAYNAAWAFPDEFPRVFSAIGSYTGLRASYEHPTLLHKTEAKPIRLFLQSGEQDMWTAFGDWWSANNAMVRALEFAGYDFRHAFGKGGHNGAHATHLAPDALRYLWKGWPREPVTPTGQHRNHFLRELLIPGKPFEEVAEMEGTCIYMDWHLVSDGKGGVHVSVTYSGSPINVKSALFIDAEGKVTPDDTPCVLAVGANGSLLMNGKMAKGLLLLYPDGNINGEPVVCKDRDGFDIIPHYAIPLRDGRFYVLGEMRYPRQDGDDITRRSLWLVNADGTVSQGNYHMWDMENMVALAADASGQWLYTFGKGRRGYSSRIEEDGTIKHTQEFFFIHAPEEYNSARICGAVCDRSGRTYLATSLGVQVCDYNGRCTAILPLPGGEPATAIAFGGKGMDILYVSDPQGKIYARPLNTKGDSVRDEPAKIRVGAG
ncbi:MAG: alpha/beta hydrolase-fold protein [Kiritimatiellaeota bacterium]|nr:alpha/beta hydrolase-fold protein [Kiritimatiellota bacterium]